MPAERRASMTAPTPEQLRGMAEALDGEARMFRPEDVVIERQSADMLRAAADKVDRLRAVIENAPHTGLCQWNRDWPCTCWKVDVL